MAWDGIEKRKDFKLAGFCPAHIGLIEELAIIKTSLKNIERTITEGVTFRTGVTIGIISVAFTLVLQIVLFSFLYGQLNRQVSINTDRLNVIEETHRLK